MKRNVDLTESRDFKNNNKSFFEYADNPLDYINLFTKSFENIENIQNELVLTGNKLQRESKRDELSFGTANNRCDCCGTEISWKFFNDSLCNRCNEYHSERKPFWL